jgi:CBS domain containing-hemolysin-like protein
MTVLVISAICSVTEAALYAVRPSFVRSLNAEGSAAGRVLDGMKGHTERPISTILIVNTAANTAGASIAGAQAEEIFGAQYIVWFSVAFTIAVLFFSEIIPKIIGVAYSDRLSVVIARPLSIAVFLMLPAVWMIQRLSRLIKPDGPIISAPEEEVGHMARMSAEEGSILPIEADLVQHVLKLNEVSAEQIMTPRSVVMRLPSNRKLRAVSEDMAARRIEWTNSRIPITRDGNDDDWCGVILRRDALALLASDEFDRTLDSFAKPLHFVKTTTPGHILLDSFIEKRSHLFAVVDPDETIVGIVTLEDVLESLIGEEIVDEVDVVVDMQAFARSQDATPPRKNDVDGRVSD